MRDRDLSERRKRRGNRRYYRKLLRWPTAVVTVDLERGGPFDMWHWHPDMWGRRSQPRGRSRHAHLTALFAALERLVREAEGLSRPLQVFAHVEDAFPSSDALYVHGPNSGGVAYSYGFVGYTFGEPVPDWLIPFVDVQRFEFGVSSGADLERPAQEPPAGRHFLVVPRGRLGRGAPTAHEIP
ncbi:MAG: hypothetical protein ABIT71_20245 [Vicinamibacteraceae bacterium]